MDIRNHVWTATLLALSALSCGDATPPPPEGAVSVSLRVSDSAPDGYACASHVLTWAKDGDAPTSTSSGGLLVDGEDGARVDCKVAGDGSYDISANVRNGNSEFSLDGTMSADGTGTAMVSFYDSNPLVLAAVTDSSCTVSVSGGSLAVESGAIWAAVACENLRGVNVQSVWCSANATIVFKSCEE